jgi:hypothetical protein
LNPKLCYDEGDDNLKKIFTAKLNEVKKTHPDATTVVLKLPLGPADITA